MSIFSRTAYHDLSDSEAEFSFSFPIAVKLLTVYLKSNVGITETITLSFVSQNGTSYNTTIDVKEMEGDSNYIYAAVGTLAINEGDSLNINVSNANATGSVYVTVKAEDYI
jgi:hypothetical protein